MRAVLLIKAMTTPRERPTTLVLGVGTRADASGELIRLGPPAAALLDSL